MDKKICKTLEVIDCLDLSGTEEIELARFLIIKNRKLIVDYPSLEDALKHLDNFMMVQD